MPRMTGRIEVVDLPKDPEVVARIIEWQIDHYKAAFPSFDHDDWTAFYSPWFSPRGRLPIVLGVLHDGRCIGTVAIVERDDLDDVDDLTPWIAAMIIDPSFRSRGFGTQLINAALDRCRAEGIPRVFLWTHDQQDWYRRTGWTELQRRKFRGIEISIFSRAL